MWFTLQKVEQTEVDLSFDLLFEAVKNDFGPCDDDFESEDVYKDSLSDYFAMNAISFLNDVFGLNFEERGVWPYYDIEANDPIICDICEAFDKYIRNKEI